VSSIISRLLLAALFAAVVMTFMNTYGMQTFSFSPISSLSISPASGPIKLSGTLRRGLGASNFYRLKFLHPPTQVSVSPEPTLFPRSRIDLAIGGILLFSPDVSLGAVVWTPDDVLLSMRKSGEADIELINYSVNIFARPVLISDNEIDNLTGSSAIIIRWTKNSTEPVWRAKVGVANGGRVFLTFRYARLLGLPIYGRVPVQVRQVSADPTGKGEADLCLWSDTGPSQIVPSPTFREEDRFEAPRDGRQQMFRSELKDGHSEISLLLSVGPSAICEPLPALDIKSLPLSNFDIFETLAFVASAR